MARTLKNSKVNPQGIDADDAYNKTVTRGDEHGQTMVEPHSAPVLDRGDAIEKNDGK